MAAKMIQQVKIMGILLYIPVVLWAGPLSGYLLGDYLARRFSWGQMAQVTGVSAGVLFSVLETFRIIRLALMIDKKD